MLEHIKLCLRGYTHVEGMCTHCMRLLPLLFASLLLPADQTMSPVQAKWAPESVKGQHLLLNKRQRRRKKCFWSGVELSWMLEKERKIRVKKNRPRGSHICVFWHVPHATVVFCLHSLYYCFVHLHYIPLLLKISSYSQREIERLASWESLGLFLSVSTISDINWTMCDYQNMWYHDYCWLLLTKYHN